MKIAIGCDHAGFYLKEDIKKYLKEQKIAHQDLGCFSTDPVDYPDITLMVAEAVKKKKFDRGMVICGTGIGAAMVANKIPGIRAALCHDPLSASFSRSHNDANILTMGGRIIGPVLACEIVRVWLTTEFSGGRHKKRLDKLSRIEGKYVLRKK